MPPSERTGSILLVRNDDGQCRPARAEEILQQANSLLSQRVRRGEVISSPQMVVEYLRLQLCALEHELFVVVFLDAQHRLIELKPLFRGTVVASPNCIASALAMRLQPSRSINLATRTSYLPLVRRKGAGHIKGIKPEDLIAQMPTFSKGLPPSALSELLNKQGVSSIFWTRSMGEIKEYTKDGVPLIANIVNKGANGEVFSHWVVVDGVQPLRGHAGEFVKIRDPWGLQYFTPVKTFEGALQNRGSNIVLPNMGRFGG
ncbi:MAG: hypothetical protein EPO01_00370 [Aquabacterium sp.]|nr:MAG: hypothetical protein EPO01_00370 [Aquabacterium sp.]